MFLAEPGTTAYDFRFGVLGFPVRVHPLFWLMALIVGFGFSGGVGIGLIFGVGVVFLSILIHELGHAIMFRRYGSDCHIVLHGFGGLAIPGQEEGPSSWGYNAKWGQSRQPTLQEQIIISFAGPAAGFILAGLTIIIVQLTGGRFDIERQFGIPYPQPVFSGALAENIHLYLLVRAMLYVNIWWGVMNLLPVYPLDGGQIALAMVVLNDPWRGAEKALWISTVTGGVVAALAALVLQELYLTLLFGSLAYSSYVALSQISGGPRGW
ncbi:MAG: site-2 protease family protein [Pirellulaceae bacterium]